MIRVIRLTSGEQVICELTTGDDTNYIVKYGFVIVPSGDDNKQISFFPLAPYSAQHGALEMRKDCVSFISEPESGIVDSYNNIISKHYSLVQ
ncbi:MAG: hypothetical protein VW715_14020 [Rhodospirillales bacterium]